MSVRKNKKTNKTLKYICLSIFYRIYNIIIKYFWLKPFKGYAKNC